MSVFLLDTHIWFWFVTGNQELKKPLRKLINQAAQNNHLTIAAITLWELSMLETKKRIILEMPTVDWLNRAIGLSLTQIIPLSPAIAAESCHLPDGFHEDPADRLIVATARVEGLTLITRDERIIAYGKKKYISVVKG